jgi:hypothetical protein
MKRFNLVIAWGFGFVSFILSDLAAKKSWLLSLPDQLSCWYGCWSVAPDLTKKGGAALKRNLKNLLIAFGLGLLIVSSARAGGIDGFRDLKWGFYWDLCGYMSRFPQKNKIAIL